MQLKWRNIFKVHFRDSIVSVICSSCKNFSSVQQAKRHTRSKEIAGTYSCIILFTNYSSLTMATSIILFFEQVWSFSNKRWPIIIDFFGKIKIYYKFFNILRFCTLGHHNKVQKIQPNTIFFSKMWENLHPQNSYPSSCVHYFMVSRRATLTHSQCCRSSKWKVCIFHMSIKQYWNLKLSMPRHCCTYSTRASHRQQCKKSTQKPGQTSWPRPPQKPVSKSFKMLPAESWGAVLRHWFKAEYCVILWKTLNRPVCMIQKVTHNRNELINPLF